MIETVSLQEKNTKLIYLIGILFLAILGVLIAAGAKSDFVRGAAEDIFFPDTKEPGKEVDISINFASLHAVFQSVDVGALPEEFRPWIESIKDMSLEQLKVVFTEDVDGDGIPDGVRRSHEDLEEVRAKFKELAGQLKEEAANMKGTDEEPDLPEELVKLLDEALEGLEETGRIHEDTLHDLNIVVARLRAANPEYDLFLDYLTQYAYGSSLMLDLFIQSLKAFSEKMSIEDFENLLDDTDSVGQLPTVIVQTSYSRLSVKQLLMPQKTGYDPKEPIIDNTGKNI